MTYALSLTLQETIYQALSASPEVAALLDGRIYDAPPPLEAPDGSSAPYLTFGDEQVDAWSASGLTGAVHEINLSVHTSDGGYSTAKRIGAAVSDVLTGDLPPMAEGQVTTAEFLSARTKRLKDDRRRIDLRFRFRIHK